MLLLARLHLGLDGRLLRAMCGGNTKGIDNSVIDLFGDNGNCRELGLAVMHSMRHSIAGE